MGFRFRKSKNFGPLRITLGKHGLGASVGVKGFRVTKSATGRTRTTASIPGTGLSYVTEKTNRQAGEKMKKKSRKVLWIVLGVIVGLCIIGAIASKGETPAPTPQPTPEPTAEVVKVLPEGSDSPQPTVSATRTFILNTSSKVYHKPSCSSAENIKEENRQEFTGTREEVEALGYEACGRCGG